MRYSVAAGALIFLMCSVALASKLSVDPNAAGAQPAAPAKTDPRLARKITYKVKLTPISTVVHDLSEMTGISFAAGKSVADWRVREDCATIHATDIPLAHLMDSIARVMKMMWIRSGTPPNWTYRLVEDAHAIRKVNELEAARKREHAAKRRAALDLAYRLPDMSEQQLKKLRDDSPEMYILAKSGLAGPMVEFLRSAPDVTEAWLQGSELTMLASRLSPQANHALVDYTRRQLTMAAATHAFPDDEDYYTRELANFDENSAKRRVVAWKPSASDPYGGISFGSSAIQISQPEDEVHRLYGKVALKVFEEKRSYREAAREMRDEIRKAREAHPDRRPYYYTGEDHLEVADEPCFHDKIERKLDSKTISGLVFQLAEATGLSIVTDNFRGHNYSRASEKGNVGEAVQAAADQGDLNWRKQNDVIEMWDTDWYRRREGRVPKAWLEAKIKKIKDTQTLEIADLAEIAALNDEQLSQSIGSSHSLSIVLIKVRKYRDYLKLYNSFTRDQRAFLFSDDGLTFGALTPAQQEASVKVFAGLDSPVLRGVDLRELGLRVGMSQSKEGLSYIYRMNAWTVAGPVPGERIFRTPVYFPPQPTSP